MSLEKPDSVGPSHVVWINPRFSPCGVVLQKSFFKRKIKVHSVALLYQVPGTTAPKFHLYLLPNDGSVRKVTRNPQLAGRSAPSAFDICNIASEVVSENVYCTKNVFASLGNGVVVVDCVRKYLQFQYNPYWIHPK